jgi:hypothetical protein
MADVDRGTSVAQDAVALYREIKVPVEEALALNLLGRLALHQRQLEAATGLLKQSVATQQSVLDAAGIAMNLEDLARVAEARGRLDVMTRLLAAADAMRRTSGISVSAVERKTFDAAVACARSALDDATFQSAWSAGAASPLDELLPLLE